MRAWTYLLISIFLVSVVYAIPAFPGAEGWGAEALSECRSLPVQVLKVTHMGDSGTGTYRQALIDARSDRFTIIEFTKGGYINILSNPSLKAKCVYLAGQTAPGSGVTLRKDSSIEHVRDAGLFFTARGRDGGEADHVVLRYIKFRQGAFPEGEDSILSSSIGIAHSHYVIFDHLSIEWCGSNCGTISVSADDYEASHITWQRNIIAESISNHPTGISLQGRHFDPQYGVESRAYDTIKFSLHHNLFAFNGYRNPYIKNSWTEVINNVHYNNRIQAQTKADARADFINNYFKSGTRTPDKIIQHDQFNDVVKPCCTNLGTHWWDIEPSLYVKGNVAPEEGFTDQNADNWPLYKYGKLNIERYPDDVPDTHPYLPESYRRYNPLPPPPIPVTIQSAYETYNNVLEDVGTNARINCRGEWITNQDTTDKAIIQKTKDGTGSSSVISHQDTVGGYPSVTSGTVCRDSDNDGMPDEFEDRYGLNKNNASDNDNDPDNDGYLNIEEYLNGEDPHNGVVTPPPSTSECSFDGDCASGEICVESVCVDKPTPPPSGCTEVSSWHIETFPSQNTPFTAYITSTPTINNMDGVFGFGDITPSNHNHQAVIVRFSKAGVIDARNFDVYSADKTINYVPGVEYDFRLEINPVTHTYDAFVSVGGVEQQFANDYSFRDTQSTLSVIDTFGTRASVGSHHLCSFEISGSSGGSHDVNGDGTVNLFDLVLVASNIGTNNLQYDVNNDGSVNLFDLVAVVNAINA